MAGFGDNSTAGIFQRRAQLGTGLVLETGEWTGGSAASICIPTTMTQVISILTESGDGSVSLTTLADVSNGYIAGTTNETTSGVTVTYVAFGW